MNIDMCLWNELNWRRVWKKSNHRRLAQYINFSSIVVERGYWTLIFENPEGMHSALVELPAVVPVRWGFRTEAGRVIFTVWNCSINFKMMIYIDKKCDKNIIVCIGLRYGRSYRCESLTNSKYWWVWWNILFRVGI